MASAYATALQTAQHTFAQQRWDEAAHAYLAAAQLAPLQPAPLAGLGRVLGQVGQWAQAVSAFEHAHALARDDLQLRYDLAVALRHTHRPHAAAQILLPVAGQKLPATDLAALLADSLLETGDIEATLAVARDDVATLRSSSALHRLRLRALVYAASSTASSLRAEATRWAQWHTISPAPSPSTTQTLPPALGAPLRVGFIGTRLCRHTIAQHLLGLLSGLDRKRIEPILYHSGNYTDDWTERLRTACTAIHSIATLDDTSAAALIRSHGIHALVDLNEHANGGRLALFSHRPAPLQAHWCGNAQTTGLAAMDIRFTHPLIEPPGAADQSSTERLFRLTTGYHCYLPLPQVVAPQITPPHITTGRLTLGATHHLAKYSEATLSAYAAVLTALPSAHLLLARDTLAEPATRHAFTQKLHAAGLPLERVELRGDTDGAIGTQQIFYSIDLYLDAWPFGADATACDALWASTPIVTLLGERIAGRRTASLLTLSGHPELVANTTSEWIDLVVSLCKNPVALTHLRATIGADFRASPACQPSLTASAWTDALDQAWHEIGLPRCVPPAPN